MSAPATDATRMETVSATVLRVLSPGGDGNAWQAIVHVADDRKSSYVRLDHPPLGLQPGDDIHLRGMRRPSGQEDVPDEIVIAPDDAEARIALMAGARGPVAISPSSSQASNDVSDLADRLGLATLLSAARRGWIRPEENGGVIGVVRSRESADPIIDWALRRFGGRDSRGAPITMVVEPLALLPRRTGSGALAVLGRAIAVWQSVLPPRDLPETPSTDYEAALASALPALGGKDRPATMRSARLLTPKVHFGTRDVRGEAGTVRIVIPYRSFETGVEFARELCSLDASGGFPPRATVAADARMRITVAHELAHTRHEDYGFQYGTLAERHAAECFADATGLICHVLETGDAASARTWADLRTVSVLGGAASHATGHACHAAIDAALRMHGGRRADDIPLDEIMLAARDVARASALPDPSRLTMVWQEFTGRNRAWGDMSPTEMVNAMGRATAAVGMLPGDPVAAHFRDAIDALSRTTFTPHDLRNPSARRAALRLERADLVETARHLTVIGMGSLVPAILESASVTSAAARKSSASAGIGRRVEPSLRDKFSFKALAGLLNGRDRDPADALALERKLVPPLRPMLDYILRADHRESPSAGLVSVLDRVQHHPDREIFDAPLAERMRKLLDLVERDRDMLERHSGNPTERGADTVESLNRAREQARKLAFSIRVRAEDWAFLTDRGSRGDCKAFDSLRRHRRISEQDLVSPHGNPRPVDTARLVPFLRKAIADLEAAAHRSCFTGAIMDRSSTDRMEVYSSRMPVAPPGPIDASAPMPRNRTGGGLTRHVEVNGSRRLHCEDDYAVVSPSGDGRAFLMGSPAVVVSYSDASGHPMATRLMDARDIDADAAVLRYGPDAMVGAPTPDHFRAIRSANAIGQMSGDVSLAPERHLQPGASVVA